VDRRANGSYAAAAVLNANESRLQSPALVSLNCNTGE